MSRAPSDIEKLRKLWAYYKAANKPMEAEAVLRAIEVIRPKRGANSVFNLAA